MNLTEEINNFIKRFLKKENMKVINAARYVVLNNGHLWRPHITLEISKGYGKSISNVMPYAVAIEFVHNATLVLDDLPSMDNSPIRRGKKSCHVKFGVDIAELCSFYLISQFISLMTKGNANSTQKVKVIEEVASTARKLIEGQEKDLYHRENKSLQELIDFYKLKSGSLYECSAVVGGILGGASPKDIKHLRNFGMNLGIAYQLGDDLYDQVGDQKKLGKPTKQDFNKKTPIDLIGVEGVISLRKKFEKKARLSLKKTSKDFSEVEKLISQISGTHRNFH